MNAKEFAERVLASAKEREAINAEGRWPAHLFKPTEHETQLETLARAYLEAIRLDA